MSDSTAILVLGMHRSGTSAVAGWLQALGINLGSHLMPADASQAKGYFEHAEICSVHEALLSLFDSPWHDPRPLPERWQRDHRVGSFRERLVEIIRRDLSVQPLWSVKDPRLCRLLPLWLEILNELNVGVRVILVLRHPAEVAESLALRNGFSAPKSGLLWLHHVLEGERNSRSLLRVVLAYDHLLRDWHFESQLIERALGIVWPRSYDEAGLIVHDLLERNLRHHKTSYFGAFPMPLRKWLVATYRAFNRSSVTSEALSAVLDDVSRQSTPYEFEDLGTETAHVGFFKGEMPNGNGLYYLQLANGTFFGYYSVANYPFLYHFGLGWEYIYDANDGAGGVYFYDFGLKAFLYTSPNVFPFLYNFSSGSWVYYSSDTSRWFYDFGAGEWVFSAPG